MESASAVTLPAHAIGRTPSNRITDSPRLCGTRSARYANASGMSDGAPTAASACVERRVISRDKAAVSSRFALATSAVRSFSFGANGARGPGRTGVLTHIAIRKSGIAENARIARRLTASLLTLRLPADAMTLPSPLPMSGPLRVKELNPAQISAVLGNDPRLIIPIGTCEQHGPHLPLGCDTIIVERMSDDLSAEYGVLRAPTVEYGVNVDTERGFTGNASLRKKTLHRLLNDLIDSWEATGVREFILLTAHGHDPHQEALATVISTAARVRVVDIFGVNLSDLLEGQREAMHGDEVDTSIMLYLAPGMVSLDQAQDYMMSREQLRRYRRGWLTVPSGSAGSIGRPSLASAAKGKLIYDRIYSKISDRIFLAPSPSE